MLVKLANKKERPFAEFGAGGTTIHPENAPKAAEAEAAAKSAKDKLKDKAKSLAELAGKHKKGLAIGAAVAGLTAAGAMTARHIHNKKKDK